MKRLTLPLILLFSGAALAMDTSVRGDTLEASATLSAETSVLDEHYEDVASVADEEDAEVIGVYQGTSGRGDSIDEVSDWDLETLSEEALYDIDGGGSDVEEAVVYNCIATAGGVNVPPGGFTVQCVATWYPQTLCADLPSPEGVANAEPDGLGGITFCINDVTT